MAGSAGVAGRLDGACVGLRDGARRRRGRDAAPPPATLSRTATSGCARPWPATSAPRAWSARTGAAVLEDDYDAEFRFDARPLDPLQSLDRRGRVVYVGTFSKVLLRTLRIG